MALNANNNDFVNIADLSAKTVSSPISPTVFVNKRSVVISAAAAATPSTSAGVVALVPVTDTPVQIAPHTYAQNGVVYFDNTPQGIALAIRQQTALQGSAGAGYHEPPGPAKPLTPAANCKNFHDPLTDADYNMPVSKYFRLSDARNYAGNIVAQRGLSQKDLACRWQNLCTDVLDHIKEKFNFGINCGFRSLEHNRAVGSTAGDNSDHCVASAADITLGTAARNIEMFKWIYASNLPYTQIILYEQGLFVHVAKGAQQSDASRKLYSPTGKNYIPVPAEYRP